MYLDKALVDNSAVAEKQPYVEKYIIYCIIIISKLKQTIYES